MYMSSEKYDLKIIIGQSIYLNVCKRCKIVTKYQANCKKCTTVKKG